MKLEKVTYTSEGIFFERNLINKATILIEFKDASHQKIEKIIKGIEKVVEKELKTTQALTNPPSRKERGIIC